MARSFSFPLPALRLAARSNVYRQLIRRDVRYTPPGLQYGVVFQTLPCLIIALDDTHRSSPRFNRSTKAPEIELRAVAWIVDRCERVTQTA